MYILVFSLTIDQKLLEKEKPQRGSNIKTPPERVWINPSSEVGGFRAKIRGSRGSAVFLLPFW
jgi:hypothetical protein